MKKFIFVIICSMGLGAGFALRSYASPPSQAAGVSRESSDHVYLKRFLNGKLGEYEEEGFWGDPVVKRRMTALLGVNLYNHIVNDIYQVIVPIEYNNWMYHAWGMQAHSGNNPGVYWAYDSREGLFYVCIRENGKDSYYIEGGGDVPGKFKELVR